MADRDDEDADDKRKNASEAVTDGGGEDEGSAEHDGNDDHLKDDQKPVDR